MAASKNQRVIIAELAKVGLKPHAIAGILANIEHESSFGTGIGTGDGGDASGIAQWHPDRFARVQRIAKKMGVPATSIRAQARALARSIVDERQSGPTGTTTVESLNRLGSASAVAKFFDENYERSDGSTRQSRMRAADNYIRMATRLSGGKNMATSGKTYTWVPGMTDVGYNPFGNTNHPGVTYNNPQNRHTGNDISASAGSKIIWAPPVTGKVIKSGWGDAYGNMMIIRDEKGREWLFAHMNKPGLPVGTTVKQGKKIGEVGSSGTKSSGAHLHIEQTRQGKGTWSYNSDSLKNPKLRFMSASDYKGDTGSPGDDMHPDDYLSGVGVARSWLDNPGMESVRRLVKTAAREEWTSEKFQQRLRETEWYISRSKAQREFDMMQSKDQAAVLKQTKAEIQETAAQFGVKLTDKQLEREALMKARNGLTVAEVNDWLARKYVYDETKGQSGLAATTQEQLNDMAFDYGVKLTGKELQKWTRKAIADGATAQEFEDDIRRRAQELFPYLTLDNMTTRDALASYLQVAQDELGVDASTIDLSDPKWGKGMFDPTTQQMVDTQTWRKKIISDKQYGWDNSRNGQAAAANLATSLGRIFGGLNG